MSKVISCWTKTVKRLGRFVNCDNQPSTEEVRLWCPDCGQILIDWSGPGCDFLDECPNCRWPSEEDVLVELKW